MNLHTIIVFDLETDGTDSRICDPVEIAAIAIHPRTLQVIKDSEFHTFIRPTKIDKEDYYEAHRDTIEWHAHNQKCKAEDILRTWKTAPLQRIAWSNFVNYTLRYHTQQHGRNIFTAPIAAGYNIIKFDLPIINRLSQKYGQITKENESNLFFGRDKLDVMPLTFYWFENSKEISSYDLDTLRDYFGFPQTGAHTAGCDVQVTTELVVRYLRLARKFAGKVRFKDAFIKTEQ
jgi:DNA polymerase III epsilon subunit-like protein